MWALIDLTSFDRKCRFISDVMPFLNYYHFNRWTQLNKQWSKQIIIDLTIAKNACVHLCTFFRSPQIIGWFFFVSINKLMIVFLCNFAHILFVLYHRWMLFATLFYQFSFPRYTYHSIFDIDSILWSIYSK